MTKMTHPRVLLCRGRDRVCCLRRTNLIGADAAATGRPARAARDGDLAVYGFNRPPHTGHDQRDRIPGRGNGDGRCVAVSVAVLNSTTITAIVPAHAAGHANIIVTNPGGSGGTLAAAFTYSFDEPSA